MSALAHRRIDLARQRVDRGQRPAFAEYDLLHGLTGIGAHLLARAPGDDALGRILAYLVRLTEPLRIDGQTLPGWWTAHDAGPAAGRRRSSRRGPGMPDVKTVDH